MSSQMQDFYERWARSPQPTLHLSPSLPDGFLVRSIKDAWFEMAEQTAAEANDKQTAAEANDKGVADKAVDIGKRILVREIMSQTDNTVVQYGSERTETGWTRHIVAFRQGEESPFLLPTVLAVPPVQSMFS